MKKNFLNVLLATLLTMTLLGCAEDEAPNSAGNPTEEAIVVPKRITIFNKDQ